MNQEQSNNSTETSLEIGDEQNISKASNSQQFLEFNSSFDLTERKGKHRKNMNQESLCNSSTQIMSKTINNLLQMDNQDKQQQESITSENNQDKIDDDKKQDQQKSETTYKNDPQQNNQPNQNLAILTIDKEYSIKQDKFSQNLNKNSLQLLDNGEYQKTNSQLTSIQQAEQNYFNDIDKLTINNSQNIINSQLISNNFKHNNNNTINLSNENSRYGFNRNDLFEQQQQDFFINQEEKKEFYDSPQITKTSTQLSIINKLKEQKFTEKQITKIQNELGKKQYYFQNYLKKGGEALILSGIKHEQQHGQTEMTQKEVVFRILRSNNIKQYIQVLDEYQQMQEIKNPRNIIKYLDRIDIPEDLITIIVVQKCEQSLNDELKAKQQISFQELLKIVFDLMEGLIELRVNGIIHLDIKPLNILKTYEGVYVYADFGTVTKMQFYGYQPEVKGYTEYYCAPEVKIPQKKQLDSETQKFISQLPPYFLNHQIQNNDHSYQSFQGDIQKSSYHESDIYSLGITFSQVFKYVRTENINEEMLFKQFQTILNDMLQTIRAKRGSSLNSMCEFYNSFNQLQYKNFAKDFQKRLQKLYEFYSTNIFLDYFFQKDVCLQCSIQILQFEYLLNDQHISVNEGIKVDNNLENKIYDVITNDTANYLLNIGICYKLVQKIEISQIFLDISYNMKMILGIEDINVFQSLIYLGDIQSERKSFKKSFDHYQEALILLEKLDLDVEKNYLLAVIKIGICSFKNNNLNKVVLCEDMIELILLQDNEYEQTPEICLNLGIFYRTFLSICSFQDKQRKLEIQNKALDYSKKALEVSKKEFGNMDQFVLESHINLFYYYYYFMGENKEAFVHYIISSQLFSDFNCIDSLKTQEMNGMYNIMQNGLNNNWLLQK